MLLLIGVGAVLASGGRDAFSPERIQREVLGLGGFGVLGFLAAAGVRPLGVVLSGSLFSVAAGLVWGPLAGTLLALAGIMVSSAVVFALARGLGAGAVRDLAGARYERFSRMAQTGGFSLVFVATLGFLFPTDLVIAIASVAGVKLRTVLAANLLGSTPGTIAMVLMGASAIAPSPLVWALGIGAIVLLTAVAAVLARQWLRTAPLV